MLLYATLLLCTCAIGAQVYRYDMYDREPPHAIILTLICGAISLHIAGLFQIWFMSWMGVAAAANFNLWMAFAAGTTEELGKISVVAFIALARPKWFNDPLDGAIYGAFAGLGAAVYESLLHLGFQSLEQLPDYLPAAEPIRLMGHLIMGGIGGFGVGFVLVIRSARRWRWLLGCLAGAMALHTMWDVIAFEASDRGRMLPWHTVVSVLLMLIGMVTFRMLVRVGASRSKVWIDTRDTTGSTIRP